MPMTPEQKRNRRARILSGDVRESERAKVMARIRSRGDGCAEWTGAWTGRNEDAYHDGRPSIFGLAAAKVAWVIEHGPWPDDNHQAAHLCHQRWCVEASHINPMLPADHFEFDRLTGHEWPDYLTHM